MALSRVVLEFEGMGIIKAKIFQKAELLYHAVLVLTAKMLGVQIKSGHREFP